MVRQSAFQRFFSLPHAAIWVKQSSSTAFIRFIDCFQTYCHLMVPDVLFSNELREPNSVPLVSVFSSVILLSWSSCTSVIDKQYTYKIEFFNLAWIWTSWQHLLLWNLVRPVNWPTLDFCPRALQRVELIITCVHEFIPRQNRSPNIQWAFQCFNKYSILSYLSTDIKPGLSLGKSNKCLILLEKQQDLEKGERRS